MGQETDIKKMKGKTTRRHSPGSLLGRSGRTQRPRR